MLPSHGRVRRFTVEWPVPAAVTAHLIVLGLVSIGFSWQRDFFPELSPDSPSDVLATVWQVHAGFVAIAFAGLALLIDMAGRDSLVRVVVERRFLLRETQFAVTFFFSLLGAIQLGVVSTWFATPGTVLVELLLVALPSILYIGVAYGRTISTLTDPIRADETAEGVLVDELRLSMDASRMLTVADQKFEAATPLRLWSVSGSPQTPLVVAARRMRLRDVHLPSLHFIAAGIGTAATSATAVDPSQPPTQATTKSPTLKRLKDIGSVLNKGDSLFVVDGEALDDKTRHGLDQLLRGAIEWAPE